MVSYCDKPIIPPYEHDRRTNQIKSQMPCSTENMKKTVNSKDLPILSLTYLSLQSTEPGTAAHAHVHEIVDSWRRLESKVQLFEVATKQNWQGGIGKVIAIITINASWAIRHLFGRKPDGAYVRFHILSIVPILILTIRKIPYALEINGLPSDFFEVRPWLRYMERPILFLSKLQCLLADLIFTDVTGRANWLVENFGIDASSIRVSPNAANTDLFHPKKVPNLGRWIGHGILDNPYCLFVGALSPWHGLTTIFQATLLKAWPEDLTVVIVGGGSLRKDVVEESRRNEKVLYLGAIEYEEVPEVINGSVFCLSLVNEQSRNNLGASPLKIYEYMACGKPVIVTDIPGQGDVVRSIGAGTVIPPGDSLALCNASRELFENSDLRKVMGNRGAQNVARNHSWEQRGRAVYEILLDVFS